MATVQKHFVVNGLTVKGSTATVGGYQVITTQDIGVTVPELDPSGFIPDSQLDIDLRIRNIAAQMILDGTHQNINEIIYDSNAGTLNLDVAGGGAADIGLMIALS